MEKYKLVGVCFRKCACVSALNSSETSRKPCKSCLSEKTHHDKQQLVMFTHTRVHTHTHTCTHANVQTVPSHQQSIFDVAQFQPDV